MIKEHMAHADIDHSPQPHAEKSTSNTQASRMPQGSARKIPANFNPMVLSEIHAAGNKDQRVSLSPGGMRPTVPRQSSRSQCTAVQHRSTGVRTAYHVPMMYPVATMDWLYPLSGFVVDAIVGLTGMGGGSLMTPLLILLFGVHPDERTDPRRRSASRRPSAIRTRALAAP